MHPRSAQIVGRRAFSFIEIVVVVVITGCIAAIAIPRLADATTHATESNMLANTGTLEKAIGFYAAEHDDRSPANETDGSVNTDEVLFVRRLLFNTDAGGDVAAGNMFGPYLADLPPNPYNGRRRIRIDGAPAGANTHGWRFNSATRIIEPDDQISAAGGILVAGPVQNAFAKEASVRGDASMAADAAAAAAFEAAK